MKKLLSVFLVVVLLFSMVVPVSADEDVVTVHLSESMTEEEFRQYKEACAIFAFRDWRSLNGATEIHEKGYYYTQVLNQPDNASLLGYQITNSEFTRKYSSSLGYEAWVSSEWIDLDVMLGIVFNSAEYEELKDYYFPKILAGIWGCRYDNPAAFDRCTNSVTIDVSLQYRGSTGKIVDYNVYAVLDDHIYYSEFHESIRDYAVAQIAAAANQQPSQYAAMQYIHDYLALNAEYDYSEYALNAAYNYTETYYYAHSSFGILNNGLGVCESYAKAFKMICDELDDAPVCALLTSETHMWNIVLLDGKWYCVDVTWDDRGGSVVVDTYFLCGDPDIVDGDSADHVPVTDFGPAPEYAQTKYQPCSHALSAVPQVDPTQTTTGVQAHYQCSLCGNLFTDAQGKHKTTLKALTIAKLPIPLSAPVIAAANVANGVKISWKAVSRAEKYFVYRRASAKDAWKRIKTTTALEHIDTAVASGNAYQYLVRAVAGAEASGYSNIVATRFLASTKVTAKNAAAGITASWSKAPGATGYTVYRRQKTSAGWSGWKKLATTKALSYTDKTAAAGKDYIYAAVAYSGSYRAYCVAGDAVRRLAVASVKTATTGNYLKITWSKATGATKYVVYRSQLSGKKWSGWSKIATTTKNTYTDKKVKSGVTYKYRVCAQYSVSKSAYQDSNSVKLLTTPKVTVKAYTKSIIAKWGKVTGATGYTVYRRQKTASGWSSWKKLANTKSLSYTDKKAKNGVQYQYTVRAYSGSVTSDIAASATACILSTPKVTLANYKSGIKVSWKKIKGAEKYVVYRSQLNGKKWSGYKKIATTKSVSYVDKTAKSKVSYKYYVVAVSGSSQSSHKATSALKYTVKK